MSNLFWGFFVLIFAGQMAWLVASASAEKWLRENDPAFEPPSVLGRLFIGRLFTSFGPMMRYGKLRKEAGQPTTLVAVFWAGFAASLVGAVLLLTTL